MEFTDVLRELHDVSTRAHFKAHHWTSRRRSSPSDNERIVEVIQLIPPERISERIVGRVVDVPVPQITKEIVEVIQLIPPERISERIIQQVVDVPLPQFPASVACITSAFLHLVVWRHAVR